MRWNVAYSYLHFFNFTTEYKYVPGDFKVTDEMKEAFDWDGALMIRYFFIHAIAYNHIGVPYNSRWISFGDFPGNQLAIILVNY